jgi:CubicO group peptidase (beta-lactamase class C family)
MHKRSPTTRRHALRMFAAMPCLLLSERSVLAAPARRWTVTGARVDKLDGLDAAMQRLLQRYGVRAGALALARQGELLFARGYTWAEPDYPVTQPASPFRLASVSKAFTAAVIYELVRAKKLELGLPVFPWLGLDRAALAGQTVDPRLATITVQQLINHRGGWDSRASNFDPVFSMRRIARRLGLHGAPSSRDIARFMVGEPLQFTPGMQEHYSNFGYVMLGLVAEKAGASAFQDQVRDQVAAPLGIERVFQARTRRDLRLPGEGFYDQPGAGLTPEFPERDVRVPLAYGGEGWLTESMTAGGGLAASAGGVARTIGHYAVWGLGLRRPNQTWARSGAMAGTSSLAISRPDGLDLCFVVNTRNFGGAKAMGEASNAIKGTLDAMPQNSL